MWESLVEADFFTRFEADRFAGRDRYLSASSRISSDTTLARLHYENTETSQLNSFATLQRILERIEESVNRDFCFDLGYSFLLSNSTYYILFYHGAYPFLTC